MADLSTEFLGSSVEGEHTALMLGGSDRIHQLLARKGGDVLTIDPGFSVLGAVQLMHDRHVGSVLAVEDTALVGIMTERDVLSRVIAANRDPATTLVQDVMTRDQVLVDPWVTVAEALEIVTRKRCRHLPVIDKGRLCGLVSAGDLAAWLVREQQLAIDDLYGYIVR